MPALSPGTRFGGYEILEPIGAGGMGEVYRARDVELGRDVAIKVLPDDFAADEERLARFRREAQVLASLNHPNIAAIYGTEQNALVLELVEGPTLAERIEQGAIPVDEALAIARQIAEALEAAHEAGIIHRDLKPANIKLQEDGTVKVLDFGLAKAIEGEAKGDASESPTMTAAATRAGVIMGTAAYMSPEQARGKRVDRRCDIWAFGAVLYEMLTGRRAFQADDISLTLAEVMKSEPDWDALPSDLSPTLRTYLSRCLEKNPKRRVRDIGDARLALEGAFETGVPQPSPAAPSRIGWSAVVAALLLGSVATGLVFWSTRPEPAHPLIRSVISAPSQPPQASLTDADLTVTPDGTRIAYVTMTMTDGRQLVVRDVSELEASTLAADESLRSPFASPDGEWIGFFTGRNLVRVSVRGGPPVMICETNGGARGASWGDDGTIVFATNAPTGLMRVPASGGEPEELTELEAGESDHTYPEILPGSKAVLFTVGGASGMTDRRIALVSLDDGSWRTLIPAGRSARYAPTGHIVYANEDALVAVGFDLERLEVTTDPVPVGIEGMATTYGAADFAIAQNGSLVYATGPTASRERTLAWVDREGREEPIAAEPRGYEYFRISPDGSRLAIDVCCDEDENGIWIWNFARSTMSRLTFHPQRTFYPVWTPDGSRVAFTTARGTAMNLFWKSADGSGVMEQLSDSANDQWPSSFTPDGRRMVFWEAVPGATGRDLFVRAMDDDPTTDPLLATGASEAYAQISPDGRWIAYRSDASGQQEIWVRPFPDVDGGPWQISRGGGHRPRWSRAERELFYVSPSGRLMSVRYDTDPFAPENPELVMEESFSTSTQFGAIYDVHPDGQRFVRIKEGTSIDATERGQLILVQNWLEELKRLVPVDP